MNTTHIKKEAERARKRAEREAKHAELIAKVAEQLPQAILDLPGMLHPHAYPSGVAASVALEVDTFEEVEPIAALLVPLPLARVSDSCLSFQPAHAIDDKHGRATVEPAGEREYKIDQVKGHPTTAEVSWYANVPGYLLSVSVKVAQHGFRITGEAARDYRGYRANSQIRWSLSIPTNFNQMRRDRFWSPPDSPPTYVLTEKGSAP